jgi:hypothetical protein
MASDRVRIVLLVTSAAGSEFVVAGPFEASVRVGGEEMRGGLADFSLDLLTRSRLDLKFETILSGNMPEQRTPPGAAVDPKRPAVRLPARARRPAATVDAADHHTSNPTTDRLATNLARHWDGRAARSSPMRIAGEWSVAEAQAGSLAP